MIRRNLILMTLGTLLIAPPMLVAHEEFRVVGTVTTRQATQIVVKATDGGTVAIAVNKQTRVTRDKKSVDLAELKPGVTVVVDALGDSEDDLLAVDVQIVPPIQPRK
ncbi:MAG: hypothetical protein ABL986_17300 [Vicinamibacterales bacterium]